MFRKLRDGTIVFLLVVLLAAFGGFAWLTHHPETPWLEKAEGWPWVGALVVEFRKAYLPPPSPVPTGDGPELEIVVIEPEVDGPIDLRQWTPENPPPGVEPAAPARDDAEPVNR